MISVGLRVPELPSRHQGRRKLAGAGLLLKSRACLDSMIASMRIHSQGLLTYVPGPALKSHPVSALPSVGCILSAILDESSQRMLDGVPPLPAMRADQIAALGAVPVSLDQLYAESDVVTLHCPSTPETRRMINPGTLSQMKDGVIFINVARGTLVDQAALLEALQSGKVGAAGLDVTDPEPIENDSPLLSMNNVVITNHCASASDRAAVLLRRGVSETVALSLRGERVPNCVNGVTR